MATPDAYDQWRRHDALQEQRLKLYPVCSYCGERIQDEHFYMINDEEICEECLIRNFRVNTEDYIE